MLHARMIAAGPHTELTGVWARRPEAAADLAGRHGVQPFTTYDDLLAQSEAVAFAVAPDAQAHLAAVAARAGKHLLLEKPLALDLAAAEALVQAVSDAGVISQMVLTQRYTPVIREFIEAARKTAPTAARVASISGAVLDGGPFATPWRLERGALWDIGPHALDLLQAAVGPIVDLAASGDSLGVVMLSARHEGGAASQTALSITQRTDHPLWACEVYGPDCAVVFDSGATDMSAQFRVASEAIPRELAVAVRSGTGHPLDAAHGLELQRLIDRAARALSAQVRSS